MSKHHWIRIFESEEASLNYIQPGRFVVMELRNEKICFTRTDKGIYAFNEKCPHNGAKLSLGFCSPKNEIICPLHRYSFDLDSGRATSGAGFALKKYPLKIQEDGVFVGIPAKWWEM
jgi:3-phenylpropionate/trans-cinnamate dioxygenase ferredoxin subunit